MSDRLSAVDEAYLVLESPAQPLHVGSIGLFDGPGLLDPEGNLRLEEVRSRVAARLDLLPRLRQRVMSVPGDLARPVWVDDERFDIANHIDGVALRPGCTEGDLLAYVERLMMEPLDRERPLWHLRFLTGMSDDRVALVERAHHAMIDGVSGVDVSITLLDATPDAVDGPAPSWVPDVRPSELQLVADGARDRIGALVGAVEAAVAAARQPSRVARGLADARSALQALTRGGARAPHCSLNQQLGSSRRIELIRQRLESVRAVGAPRGATVNDVVLTAIAGGLRALFMARGEQLGPDRTVHALVPVSFRSDDGAPSLGNRVGGLVVPLPIGIGDPEARLDAVTAATAELKASGEATVADEVIHALDLLPPRLAHVLQHSIDHQPLVNLVVTNIPGPPFPLFALGSRMLEAFPLVPLGARMTLEVAVLSYDGALTLGVVSDRAACPDAPTFTRGVEDAFTRLGAAREHEPGLGAQ